MYNTIDIHTKKPTHLGSIGIRLIGVIDYGNCKVECHLGFKMLDIKLLDARVQK